MAVIDCDEIQGRTASINSKYETSYSRSFLVKTDSTLTSPVSIRDAPGIFIEDVYPFDSNAVCTSVNVSPYQDDSSKHFVVTVEYGKREDKEENPLDEPAQIEWSFAQFERPIDFDIDGQAIVNAAGDPFLEAVTKDDSRPILTITRNEASFNAALAYSYRDVVNRSAFQGAPRGTVKVSNISGSRQFDQQIGFYWVVRYEFAFNLEGWKKKVLNVGFRELNLFKRKNILVDGQPVNDPVPLDAVGAKLPAGIPPIFLEFTVYNEADFSVFGF